MLPHIEQIADQLLRIARTDGAAFVVDRRGWVIEHCVGIQSTAALEQLARIAREQAGAAHSVPVPDRDLVLHLPTMARVGSRFVLMSAPASEFLLVGAIVPLERVPDAMEVFENAWRLVAGGERKMFGGSGTGGMPPQGEGGAGGQGAEAVAGFASYLPRQPKKFPVG